MAQQNVQQYIKIQYLLISIIIKKEKTPSSAELGELQPNRPS